MVFAKRMIHMTYLIYCVYYLNAEMFHFICTFYTYIRSVLKNPNNLRFDNYNSYICTLIFFLMNTRRNLARQFNATL